MKYTKYYHCPWIECTERMSTQHNLNQHIKKHEKYKKRCFDCEMDFMNWNCYQTHLNGIEHLDTVKRYSIYSIIIIN